MHEKDVASSVDEQRLRTELLLKLSNALDDFVAENHEDIQKLKGNKLIEIWNAILTILEQVWWTIDQSMEAIDSIPDILQGYVQRFKKNRSIDEIQKKMLYLDINLACLFYKK